MKTNRFIVYFACLLVGFVAAISLNQALAFSSNPEIADLQTRVIALERRVGTLESALRVTASSVSIVSPGSVSIVTPGSITLQASGLLSLRGALINMNNNGRPVARIGDQVMVGINAGVITSGSTTVLAN